MVSLQNEEFDHPFLEEFELEGLIRHEVIEIFLPILSAFWNSLPFVL
jgi:hypothetical protein